MINHKKEEEEEEEKGKKEEGNSLQQLLTNTISVSYPSTKKTCCVEAVPNVTEASGG